MKRGEQLRGAGDGEAWWTCRLRRGAPVPCEICGQDIQLGHLYVTVDWVDGAWCHDYLHNACAEMAAALDERGGPGGRELFLREVADVAKDEGWTFDPVAVHWTAPETETA